MSVPILLVHWYIDVYVLTYKDVQISTSLDARVDTHVDNPGMFERVDVWVGVSILINMHEAVCVCVCLSACSMAKHCPASAGHPPKRVDIGPRNGVRIRSMGPAQKLHCRVNL